ncbi:MAG: response regulator [Pseudomonadota bacterium]|jgi:CheY-like chemotaxis protein|nr:response regulator [Pseudomonadota bacterium]
MSAASVTVLPRRTPPTILIVEDEALARCLVSDELRSRGFKVLEAGSAPEALMVLDSVRVDLLLIAVDLSGARSGLEIARLVHGRRAPVQIILTLSEQGSPPDPDWESLGLLIRKPYLASQILEFIARRFNWPIPPDAIPDE